MIDIYGQGLVGEGLEVFELLDPRNQLRYEHNGFVYLDSMSEFADESRLPLPPFPAGHPSLLTIGSNGSADAVFLVVDGGVASDATLWIGNVSADVWIEDDGPLAAVLLRAITGQFDGRGVLGDGNWRLQPKFTPIHDA